METWPEFVKDSDVAARRAQSNERTGWETVVFQVEDLPPPPSPPESELSTAAIAP